MRRPWAPPHVPAVHAMCTFHQQRPPQSSQTCHGLLPQVAERWAHISPLGPPSQSCSWARDFLLGLPLASCSRGRAGSAGWLRELGPKSPARPWVYVDLLPPALSLRGWVTGATESSLPLSAPGAKAALLLSPPLGSSDACSGFGELLEVGFFFLTGARKLIYSVNLN